MRRNQVGTDNGTAVISPNTGLRYGRGGTWCIEYTAGKRGIDAGGSIRFTMPEPFADAQITKPYGKGYTTVSCTNPEVKLELNSGLEFGGLRQKHGTFVGVIKAIENDKEKKAALDFGGYNFFIKVTGAPLREGEKIKIIYGDISYGGPGGFIGLGHPKGPRYRVLIATDVSGKLEADYDGYEMIKEVPYFEMASDPPQKFMITLPSIISKGDVPRCKVAVLNSYNSPVTAYQEKVELLWNAESVVDNIDIPAGDFCDTVKLSAPSASVSTVTIVDKKNLLIGRSNPVRVGESGDYKVFWGDLHGKTSASLGPDLYYPEDYYRYARDVAHLDFAATADICHEFHYKTTPEEWQRNLKAAADFNRSGEFVTIPGYEYNEREIDGDRNVYYFDEKEAELLVWEDERTNSPEKLWKALEGKKAMTIPHHTVSYHNGTCWKYRHPHFERLAEICSQWGVSETYEPRWPLVTDSDYTNRSVRVALNKGLKLGFIGSSDAHDGRPGISPKAAVLARNLTREEVWDALWNRRCYASTGPRIIVNFKINGKHMGSDLNLTSPVEKRAIELNVVGTDQIECIELIRNGEKILAESPAKQQIKFTFVDEDDLSALPLFPLVYYYPRIIQKDGHMAWASPIWISIDLKASSKKTN